MHFVVYVQYVLYILLLLNQQLDTRFSWGWAVKSNPGIYCKLQAEVDVNEVEGKE